MHAVDRIAWKAFEEAVREHGLGASRPFSAGWKIGCTVPGKISVLRQLSCSPKQHGGTAVMAASMHAARIGRGIGRPACSVNARASMSARKPIALLQEAHQPDPYPLMNFLH
jgi:hypothetical protein